MMRSDVQRRTWRLLTGILLLALAGLAPSMGVAPPDPRPTAAATTHTIYLPFVRHFSNYLNDDLARATYASLLAMVEPSTGLPHDRFDASIYDIAPQLAVMRTLPYTSTAVGASLTATRCSDPACRHDGGYGLQLDYQTPANTFASYNFDAPAFNVSGASYLEGWVKGAQGGERFELVLWSNCQGNFPGRPDSAMIAADSTWARWRIPLAEFLPAVDPAALCRLSIGFNDAMHPGGTIFLDGIAFVDGDGNRVHVPLDETTNVTNIGLYIAEVIGALDMARELPAEQWESYAEAVARLERTLTSVEAFQTRHGFPQTHNHVVSLRPGADDICISTVDLGNYAAGLILLRQRIPALAARASALLDAMEWGWLFDAQAGLPYGCRYPDGSASTWHYDWLAADSRLAHTIGIGSAEMPAASWGKLNRSHETPLCVTSDRWHFQPGWQGGGLFMALLPGIFLDEARSELGTSARNFVQDQICYADAIGAPAWGWSATALPPHGADYCGYGRRCDDILVPHASIMAVETVDAASLEKNLKALEALDARTLIPNGAEEIDFGFRASVNWRTGEVATVYLFLDQSMAFLSLVNATRGGHIRDLFCQDPVMQAAISQIPDYAQSCIGATP